LIRFGFGFFLRRAGLKARAVPTNVLGGKAHHKALKCMYLLKLKLRLNEFSKR
jgi:hypothetical protein